MFISLAPQNQADGGAHGPAAQHSIWVCGPSAYGSDVQSVECDGVSEDFTGRYGLKHLMYHQKWDRSLMHAWVLLHSSVLSSAGRESVSDRWGYGAGVVETAGSTQPVRGSLHRPVRLTELMARWRMAGSAKRRWAEQNLKASAYFSLKDTEIKDINPCVSFWSHFWIKSKHTQMFLHWIDKEIWNCSVVALSELMSPQ